MRRIISFHLMLLIAVMFNYAIVLAAPVVEVRSSPSGVQAFGTTQATLEIKTDVAATCKYGTTPGVVYATIPNTFTSTGGTTHSTNVTGLNNGQRYNYYIRCDSGGSFNTSDYVLSFSVQSSPGLIPADRLVDWTPGERVGVPGGIPNMPYSSPHPITVNGVVIKTIPAGKVIDVTKAPYNASRSALTSRGSIAAGSNQLIVATLQDFAVGHYVIVKDADTHIYDPKLVVELLTRITAINGNTLTLEKAAKVSAQNTMVLHYDVGSIMQAISEAQPGDVVYLPAGRYMMYNQPIYMYANASKDMITLRGAGMDNTVLDCAGTSYCIVVGSGIDYQWALPEKDNVITSGLTKGSTAVTIADATPFSVGELTNLRMTNDLTMPVFGAPYFSRGQVLIITGKTGNTLNVWPPLYDDYGRNGVTAKLLVHRQQSDFNGIEDLTIEANHSAQTAISFDQTYASWIKNVRTHHTTNFTVGFGNSLNCEIRHSFIDEGKVSGSNGWGIGLGFASGCLIEDNTITHNSPTIEINGGSSGNVIAYNYSADPLSIDFDTNHGPHNSFNLYEGNLVYHIISDGYFGSESHGTIFRNWIKGGGWWTVNLKRWSREFSVVGNVLGLQSKNKAGGNESYGLPNIGNDTGLNGESGYAPPWSLPIGQLPASAGYQELDTNVLATTIRKGNYNYSNGSMQPLAPGETLPLSLFRNSKPDYFGDLAWPPIDPSNPPVSGGEGANNPANNILPSAYRYIHKGDEPPGVPTPSTYTFAVSIFGNGTGSVTSTAPGINCGSDCIESANVGTSYTLNAIPLPGSVFQGWSGGECSGTGTCVVSRNSVVLAQFNSDTAPSAPGGLKMK